MHPNLSDCKGHNFSSSDNYSSILNEVSSKQVKVGKSNAQNRLKSTFSMESKSKPLGSEPEPHHLKIKRLEGEVASQKLKLKTLMERNSLLDTELKSSKYQHDVHALKIGELTDELTQSKDLVNTLELEINQQRAKTICLKSSFMRRKSRSCWSKLGILKLKILR